MQRNHSQQMATLQVKTRMTQGRVRGEELVEGQREGRMSRSRKQEQEQRAESREQEQRAESAGAGAASSEQRAASSEQRGDESTSSSTSSSSTLSRRGSTRIDFYQGNLAVINAELEYLREKEETRRHALLSSAEKSREARAAAQQLDPRWGGIGS